MAFQVLIVDDDADFVEELASLLEDFELRFAENGDEAVALLARPNEIDVVILDVKMPGMSGTEVLKKIKKIDPEIYVIIITGYSTKEVAVESLKGHADDYIEKPLEISKVRGIVGRLYQVRRGPDIAMNGIRAKVERVKQFAERNAKKRVTLKEAARIVCLSPKYLSRAFKEHTGRGFKEYQIHMTLKEAEKLLLGTDYTVEQIALEMGYENPESFFRIFKKFKGVSPGEYREKHRKREKR
jgi:YesN/AraC family two-component response regulator